MATEIELTTKINTANSAQSIGQLNKSLKDLISLQNDFGAGSKEYERLSKAINDTEGKIGDLKDSFSTLRGSGVERLNQSFGLLRESLTSGDIGKAKIAFDGLKGAMSAVPIFLLIEGFKALIDNFDAIVNGFKDIAGIQSETQKEINGLTKAIDNQKKADEALFAGLENQIKILEAQKASEEKILGVKKQLTEAKIKEAELDIQLQKAKIKDIILNDDLSESLYRTTAAILRKTGKDLEADAIEKKLQADKNERLKEASDELRKDLINIQNLKTSQAVDEIKVEQDKQEKIKKASEDRFKREEELRKANQQRERDILLQTLKDDEYLAGLDALDKKQKQEDADALAAYQAEKLNQSAQLAETFLAKQKADREQDRAEFIADQNARLGIATSSIQSLQGLSDLVFSIRQANTKKGSAEEEAAARKQFAINKGLQIANATISGAQGVLMAATQPSGVPIPFDIPFRVAKAVGIGLTTAATISKIAGTQFNAGSGGGGGGSISSGSSSPSSIGGGASVPQNQNIRSLDFNQGTVNQIGSVGGGQSQNQLTKVVLVEHDVTQVQNKVKTVQSIAKFP